MTLLLLQEVKKSIPSATSVTCWDDIDTNPDEVTVAASVWKGKDVIFRSSVTYTKEQYPGFNATETNQALINNLRSTT